MDPVKNINAVFQDKKTFRSDLDNLIFFLSKFLSSNIGADIIDDIGNIIEELTFIDDKYIIEKSQQLIIPLYQKLKKINKHDELYNRVNLFTHYYFHINNKDRCLKTLNDINKYYKSINIDLDIDGIVNCLSKIDKEFNDDYINEECTLSSEEHVKLHENIEQLSTLESKEINNYIKYMIEQITIYIFSVISINELP